MIKRFGFPIYLLIIVGSVFCSCYDLPLYSETQPIDSSGWFSSDTVNFEFNVDDATKRYNCLLDLRHTGDYPFSNIYLFVEVEYPNGKTRIDTINEVLSDSRGYWYGSGLGDMVDHRIGYQTGIEFPLEGLYRINITHGMRLDPLEEVTDLGLRLEDVSL